MKLACARLAFDYGSSSRTIDRDGRLHVRDTPITKATVNVYYGHEIPNGAALGLDPSRTYRLFRDPIELEKAASSFNSLPLLSRHVHVNAQDHQPDMVVGSTGTNTRFEAPYLKTELVVWASMAIDSIDNHETRELSAAYRYRPVMERGVFQGMPYDGRMTEINGSHVALVREGRAGPDVCVVDSGGYLNRFPNANRLKA